MNKYFVTIFSAALLFAGCSLISSPSQTAKSWISFTEKGKTDDALKLFSSKAMRERGARIKSDLDSHITGIARMQESGKSFSVEKMEEKITGETAVVSFIYRAGDNDSLRMTFGMIKENGEWKIDRIGDVENDQPAKIEPTTPMVIDTPFPEPKEYKKK